MYVNTSQYANKLHHIHTNYASYRAVISVCPAHVLQTDLQQQIICKINKKITMHQLFNSHKS